MSIKANKILSITLISTVGIVFLLSSLAMSPSQATPTPTSEPSATNTQLPTSIPTVTATFTPSSTPSPIPTPAFPSAQDIHEELQSNFDQINAKLEKINQQTESSFLRSVRDNLVSNGIWDGFLFLGGLALAKIISKFKNDQDESRGKAPNKTLKNLEVAFDSGFRLFLTILIVYSLLVLAFSLIQSIPASTLQSQFPSQQLEPPLQATPTTAPNASPTYNPPPPVSPDSAFDSTVSLVIAVALLLFYLFIAQLISRNQAKLHEISLPKLNWDELGRKLLPSGILILILYLLPYPVDSFLMPILTPFLIVGFFELVTLYPNSHLKNVFIKYYSIIIFVAMFGVWFSVFGILQGYVSPLWSVTSENLRSAINEYFRVQPIFNQRPPFISIQFWYNFPTLLMYFIWNLLPFVLALVFAIAPHKMTRKLIKEKYISKTITSARSKSRK